MKTRSRAAILAAMMLAFACSVAHALINPNFTPVHLAAQSALILELDLGAAKDGRATATVKRVIKGKTDATTLTFDFNATAMKDKLETVRNAVLNGSTSNSVILFVGEFNEDGSAPGAERTASNEQGATQGAIRSAYLHVNGSWLSFLSRKEGRWDFNDICGEKMIPTWNGGTDMLIKAINYVISDPDAEIPVKDGVAWARAVQCGRVEGTVRAAIPVCITPEGEPALFIASDAGDALLAYAIDRKALVDSTAKHKLASKSTCAAWGAFTGNGWMDLASWNGTSVTIYAQGADGTFQKFAALGGDRIKDCLNLETVDCGVAGRAALVIATTNGLVFWEPASTAAAPRQLTFDRSLLRELGIPGRCLVADFDGDSHPDIIQLFERGSIRYQGKGGGQFEPGVSCPIAAGSAKAVAFLGDFDADGLLDVVTIGDTFRLWRNRGKFQFVDVRSHTGEASGLGSDDISGGSTVDFNHDGRQDISLIYSSGMPRLFFNRGFCSFGVAMSLNLVVSGTLPAAANGAAAACWADFDGDGTMENALVLADGSIWMITVDAGEATGRSVRGILPARNSFQGPVSVIGYTKKGRCLGAWNVLPGVADAFVAQAEAGPVVLKWQFPGGSPREKEVVLENEPRKVLIVP